ncbi:DNA methylase N-4 [Candidatus Curtissbacteria bacterium RIFCSPLOWO2_01_FULL_38_11b]|uniref:Methyltransferase n=1 Tax=Candidatus Curtissbacteria bacterium RIFCSPLOWO2_01_FULL_38_11b TaxID=1797725 RepID=A0A1F5H3C5_9BACT|nr:MAG: DNA methylase N-4 [Candidatus Curtissbacteria bacterium RIFCSPLOWO2_01_FULL_38_11b]
MGTKVLEAVAQKAYFKDQDFVLFQGDSINYLKKLPEDSIDMIFADPPYNLSNGGFTVHAGKRVSVNKGKWDESQGIEEDFEFHARWINECYRVLKPNGTIWISGTYHSIYQCGFALQLKGYKILNDIAWFKPNASPNLSGRYFTASHETLIWARKDPKGKHTYNYQDMKNGEWHETDIFKNTGKQMRSVWSIQDDPNVWVIGTPKREEKTYGKHPTQKPIALLERVILSSTNPGDVILDPFTGSSTTGLAAVKNGRKFVGIDTEKEYLNLSIKRYYQLQNNVRLL